MMFEHESNCIACEIRFRGYRIAGESGIDISWLLLDIIK